MNRGISSSSHGCAKFLRNLSLLLLASFAFLPAPTATEASADAGNRALAAAFEAAWNAHDMATFGTLLTSDVDWVNVDGFRGRGREMVELGHARVHAGKFKNSVMTLRAVEVIPLARNIALVHVSWGLRGDRNNDGTEREPREGLFTWVTVQEGSSWKIRASHNTNKAVIR